MVTQIKPDAESLRALLKDFNEIDPAVKRATRRALRTVGDDVIAGQRAILDGPLPQGVAVVGKTPTLAFNSRTGKPFLRIVNIYGATDVNSPGRSSGLRERIKGGLVTRVVTGTTRQSIEIKTQNSKAPMSTGYNSTRFRHPVFGKKDKFALQSGMPYFFEPIFKGRDAMIAAAVEILNEAIER